MAKARDVGILSMTQFPSLRTADRDVDALLQIMRDALEKCDALDGLQQAGIYLCHAIEIVEARAGTPNPDPSGEP